VQDSINDAQYVAIISLDIKGAFDAGWVARDPGIPKESKMSGKSLQTMRELLQRKDRFFNNEKLHSAKKNKQRLLTGLSVWPGILEPFVQLPTKFRVH